MNSRSALARRVGGGHPRGRFGVCDLRVVLVLLLIVASLSLVPAASGEHVATSKIQWACGGGGSHPDQCGINAIHDPSFDEDPWIDEDDRVMGVEIGGDAKAYAIQQLDRHEVVNDVVGGSHVAVTWCPLCGSAIVFDRVVPVEGESRLLDFEVSGYLYKNDLVMWDQQSGTLWNQIEGRPIGTLVDNEVRSQHPEAKLSFVPSELTTWGDWQERHPGSKLLDRVTVNGQPINYGEAYPGYDSSCRFGISGQSECDVGGLHPKEQVVGVRVDEGAAAYPLFAVREAGGVVVDDSSGRELVVTARRGGATQVFDGEDHGFTREDGGWVDDEGRGWDLAEGRSLDGFDRLAEVEHLVLFWFAWNDHEPDTALWLPDDVSGAMARKDTGLLPDWSWGFVVFFAGVFLVGVAMRRRVLRNKAER